MVILGNINLRIQILEYKNIQYIDCLKAVSFINAMIKSSHFWVLTKEVSTHPTMRVFLFLKLEGGG